MTVGNRIDRVFAGLRERGENGLMPFVCGGWPSTDATAETLVRLSAAGASVIEVGIPFSDPIADGPVIASAMHNALEAGVTTSAVLDAAASVRGEVGCGLVAMVSVSIVERHGAGAFADRLAQAGFDGVILPDVPLEECERLAGPMRGAGLTVSLLVAPTTPAERAKRVAAACSGFVYLLARTGITGETGGGVGSGIAGRVGVVRGATELPIACGFGIGSAADVRKVVREGGADAAIVGSALVKRMSESAGRGEDAATAAEGFVRELLEGLG